jgi:DNA (cytosine-5)-methyltransferase 1
MRHGSLFSGIGGFDLASEWMGWENVFHCEWNEFGQKVLKYYWPKAITYNDITKTDFTIHRGTIDILTGGFPCQPYSSAGKRLGKEDERHLWPEMLRAIREIQPTWVVGENVYGIINWNRGLVFEEVQTNLETEGYEVQSFILPAASVNAPHKRDRIWFVAYSKSCSDSRNSRGISNETKKENTERIKQNSASKQQIQLPTESNPLFRNDTNSECIRLELSTESRQIPGEKTNASGKRNKSALSFKTISDGFKSRWDKFPISAPICDGDDGISNRLDGITFSKWRNESIKAGGNAVVPQVVYQIFKAINQYNQLNKQLTL